MLPVDANVGRVINASCADAMADMPDSSVDAIITDPPYGLAFMGAKWDSFGGTTGRQGIAERRDEGLRYATKNDGAPRYANSHGRRVTHGEMESFQLSMTPIFEEALRVAKPGAHLLCFGGTRTFHRMACAIEDAGWEIRDCIMWVYGSGFPKSMDVAKAIDKASGYVGEVIGERTVDVGMQGGHMHAGRERKMQQQQRALSPEASAWNGWGTCLKPAWEPIIVARKPLDGTVANTVLKWGTGAINVDACRVPIDDGDEVFAKNPHTRSKGKDSGIYGKYDAAESDWSGEKGRFPANLAHDGSEDVLALFPDTGTSSGVGGFKSAASGSIYGTFAPKDSPDNVGIGDAGNAARFFYCAKASKRDRGEGNDHPTVKPIALMEWLVRMVSTDGGLVLDPFMGSGSTLVACKRLGRKFIGIDMNEHYCEIAELRLASVEWGEWYLEQDQSIADAIKVATSKKVEQPKLFELEMPRPDECPHELNRADIGAGKSLCDLMGCWTNCLEEGRCIAYDLGKEVDFDGN